MPRVAVKDAKGGGGEAWNKGSYLSFAVAKAIVWKLKLERQEEWKAWSKSGQRPSNIPSDPARTYRDDGWISYPDWLGYEGRAPPGKRKDMLPFVVARAIVRKLKLKSEKEWKAWSKSGQRPSNIPSTPHKVYRDDGWISMPDWLGYDEVDGSWNKGKTSMLPFSAARMLVRKLKLKGTREWKAWSKSGQRPSNIPSCPQQRYRGGGWISYPDWLGYGSAGGGGLLQSSSVSNGASAAPDKEKKEKNLPPPPPPRTRSSTAATPQTEILVIRRREVGAPCKVFII